MSSYTIAVRGTYFPPNSNYSSNSGNRSFHERNHIISLIQRCKKVNQVHQIHAKIIRNGFEQDPFVLFNLLRLCSNFNSMGYASKIFKQIENPNVYLYTALIDGHISSCSYKNGIQCYVQMMDESIKSDAYVISSVLKACGSQLSLREGKQIHNQILKLQLDSNRSIQIKLIELYGKCGEFSDAHKISDKMPERDVATSTVMLSSYFDYGLVEEAFKIFESVRSKDTVCWTAMIDGLVGNGEMNKALDLFRKMLKENVRPNEVTIVCVLSACSQLGALELGKWIHTYIDKYKIKLNHFVGSALINMYSKCGCLEEAERVFSQMEDRTVSTYNSMLAGYAIHGKSTEALGVFNEMVKIGLKPNDSTFVTVLNACSHGGLLNLGLEIFLSMRKDFGINPRIEHYGCIVDLLGRLGELEEAYDFIKSMEVEPDYIIWGSLLSACKIHGDLTLGEKVAKVLINGGFADSGTYILLANIYSSLGKFEESVKVRAKMKDIGIKKEPGCSSIEVNNKIHEFLLGDIGHPERKKIYKKLEDLDRRLRSEEDYVPETEIVLHDIEEREKEWALSIHSEKLAICYGLISTEPGTTIRVSKNLRVCNDCHSMIKLTAKMTQRKIVVRDRNRFHHFENGFCSCGDFW